MGLVMTNDQQKYNFLQFENFSYNEALNNYADMQDYFRHAISQAYIKAYGGPDYNKYKDILEQTLTAINVFEYSGASSSKKMTNFPTEADLKKLDKHFVEVVRDAQKTTETFIKIIKEHYNVENRDEFSNTYGKDVRLDRNANAVTEKGKYEELDRQTKEKRQQYLNAGNKLGSTGPQIKPKSMERQ